ncbi:hypothetical protein D9M70_646300 [compost metagenome]
MRQFHRIPRVPEAFEVDAFDYAACINVQAGNNAYGYSHVLILNSAVLLIGARVRYGRRGCC